MLARKMKLMCYEDNGYWCDMGDIRAYKACTADILNGKLCGYEQQNRIIGKNTVIDPSALITDGCVIGSSVSVGKGAKLKNCVVMRNCIIGEGCELEHVIVDKDCVFSEDCKLTGNAKLPVVVPKASKL